MPKRDEVLLEEELHEIPIDGDALEGAMEEPGSYLEDAEYSEPCCTCDGAETCQACVDCMGVACKCFRWLLTCLWDMVKLCCRCCRGVCKCGTDCLCDE